ncbi:MAG TPA: aminotransferase class V-fold PLP-dependent enzyme [Streptosporangiaceae bacterium]|nr:aminotransferase class V-fold PLP-dependent enzyme [Streptosporangiaceae bacterium]
MDLAQFRALVPLTRQRSYFFAGAISPATQPVLAASQRYLAALRDEPLSPYQSWPRDLEELRRGFAALIGAPAAQVAITDNTSRASALAIRLLDRIDPAGAVVVDDTTYPSSIYTWLTHGRHEIRPVATRSAASSEEAAAAIAAAVDDSVLAVVVSHVCPLTGFRHDLQALAGALRGSRALLMVDAAQSLGVVPVDVARDGVDVLVATSMKWLLGMPGIGYLYLAPEVEQLAPALDVGYAGLADQGARWPRAQLPPAVVGAARFECGIPALGAIPAATAGLGVIADVGVPAIAGQVTQLVTHVLGVLRGHGLRPVTPEDERMRAGVVAAYLDGADDLAAALARRGVDVGGYPWGLLRIDPHAYCSDDDIQRLDGALGEVL